MDRIPNTNSTIRSQLFEYRIIRSDLYYTVTIISIGVRLEGNLLSNQTPTEVIETVI